MNEKVHVLAGHFATERDAVNYSEEQWEPEPDQSVSDEECSAWEDRNPHWALRDELGVDFLDHDFIETISGPRRYHYLNKMLVDPDAIGRIKSIAGETANTLVLVFDGAFGGFEYELQMPQTMVYCGEYECDLSRLT
jgi:hypothetical protein